MGKIYIIAGPTASGKSEYAINFALKNMCEILYCDASAIYKGMNIGTAKPSCKDLKKVPHWGIDLTQPTQVFSVNDYSSYVIGKVKDIINRGKNVLVTGGSGFYLNTFLRPVTDSLNIPKEVVTEVEEIEKKFGNEGIIQALKKLNPDGFPYSFDTKNPIKTKKALERCLASGLDLYLLRENFYKTSFHFKNFAKETFLIDRPIEILKQRVCLRTKKMIKNGLVEEVEKLIADDKLNDETPAAKAIGYRETIYFLKKTDRTAEDLNTLEESIIKNTFALIKKQNTWFRGQMQFNHRIYL